MAADMLCSLLPAIAFILDMRDRTNGFYGINEGLFASALPAIVFSLLSAQPLTIVGITGLISLFNYTIYDIIAMYDVTLFPALMVWVSIWSAIFHWIVAVFNLCDYMRYVTDFSSESFGYYVSIVYLSMSLLRAEEARLMKQSQGGGTTHSRVHQLWVRGWIHERGDRTVVLRHRLCA